MIKSFHISLGYIWWKEGWRRRRKKSATCYLFSCLANEKRERCTRANLLTNILKCVWIYCFFTHKSLWIITVIHSDSSFFFFCFFFQFFISFFLFIFFKFFFSIFLFFFFFIYFFFQNYFCWFYLLNIDLVKIFA